MNQQRQFQLVGTITGFAGVLIQYIATMQQFSTPLVEFMSYFTILTNLLVSVYFTALLFSGNNTYQFAQKASTGTAITVYILVVGLVYQTLLRNLYAPQGLFLLSDNMVHGWMPLFTLVYWIKYVYGQQIGWKVMPLWLVYPLLFLFYSLIRGHFSQWYPYPFLDVVKLGYTQVWLNSGGMSAVFIILSAIMIGLSNRKYANNNLK